MPDSPIKIDVAGWVEQARTNPAAHRQRQGVVTILNAIAAKAPLNKKMFLKGGILMGLAYDSPRQTVDIDLTTSLKAEIMLENGFARKFWRSSSRNVGRGILSRRRLPWVCPKSRSGRVRSGKRWSLK